MKKLWLCLIVGATCLGIVSSAGSQQGQGKGKASSGDLPAAVCQAIEQYIAKIDSARSISDKTQRTEKYTAAENELATVLKRHDRDSLLTQASAYARYTELVASSDPSDTKFSGLLEQRLNSRAALLEMCASYTTSR